MKAYFSCYVHHVFALLVEWALFRFIPITGFLFSHKDIFSSISVIFRILWLTQERWFICLVCCIVFVLKIMLNSNDVHSTCVNLTSRVAYHIYIYIYIYIYVHFLGLHVWIRLCHIKFLGIGFVDPTKLLVFELFSQCKLIWQFTTFM